MVGKRLKYGDTIGIVAPASFSSEEKIESAKKNLENLGFKVVLGECTKKRWFSYAGTDRERSHEINRFFKDPQIDAIICMRGGYGCNRIVELLDYEVIKKNPKIFVGYSDITTLHISLNEKAGLITFHGPMAVSNFSGEYDKNTYESFIQMVNGKELVSIKNFSKEIDVISSGKGQGRLVGGNLATLIATLGTEYDIDYNGKILFLEEVGEKTYKIDRMLNQLKKHKVFEKVSGIILGDFKNCDKDAQEDMSLKEVFKDYFKDLSIPVLSGVESGHSEPMLTLPLGAMCKIDSDDRSIEILEKVAE